MTFLPIVMFAFSNFVSGGGIVVGADCHVTMDCVVDHNMYSTQYSGVMRYHHHVEFDCVMTRIDTDIFNIGFDDGVFGTDKVYFVNPSNSNETLLGSVNLFNHMRGGRSFNSFHLYFNDVNSSSTSSSEKFLVYVDYNDGDIDGSLSFSKATTQSNST